MLIFIKDDASKYKNPIKEFEEVINESKRRYFLGKVEFCTIFDFALKIFESYRSYLGGFDYNTKYADENEIKLIVLQYLRDNNIENTEFNYSKHYKEAIRAVNYVDVADVFNGASKLLLAKPWIHKMYRNVYKNIYFDIEMKLSDLESKFIKCLKGDFSNEKGNSETECKQEP